MKYVVILSGVLFMMLPITVSGGNIDSPAGPDDSGSAMYKVDDIYNRLNSGAAGVKRSGAFAGTVSGPGSASRTLDEVMGIAPAADDSNGAATGNVSGGKTFWGLTSGQWGPQTGTMSNNGAFALSCGVGDQGVTAGYYSGGTLAGDCDLVGTNIRSSVNIFGVTGTVIESSGDAVAGDVLTGKTFSNAGAAGVSGTMADNGAFALSCGVGDQGVTAGYYSGGTLAGDCDLVAGNILNGVDIFGVTGTATVAAYPAVVPKTGQTDTVPIAASPGSDGNLQRGVSWPNPRFTDNSNGTVTDNLTGLIWLKNANCVATTRSWTTALSDVTHLNTDGTMNSNNCGDTSNSGSNQTDWRLPNRFELESLLDLRYSYPPVSNTAGTGQWTEGQPFSGVQSNTYWSGSTYVSNTANAWLVSLGDGNVHYDGKTSADYVWPVRGGQ